MVFTPVDVLILISVSGWTESGNDEGNTQPKRKRRDPTVSWDLLSSFSMPSLRANFLANGPVIWTILRRFVEPTKGRLLSAPRRTTEDVDSEREDMDLEDTQAQGEDEEAGETGYRPKDLVSHAISYRCASI